MDGYHPAAMRRHHFYLCGALLAATVACEVVIPPPTTPNRLVKEAWALGFEAGGGTGSLKVEHQDGTILAELHGIRLVLGRGRKEFQLGLQSVARRGDAMVLSCAPHPDHEIEIELRLDDAGQVRVEVTDSVGLESEVCELTVDYTLPEFESPDETWLPHRHPNASDVAGDGSFHSPIAFVRRGRFAVVLQPDLVDLSRNRRIPQALELDTNLRDSRGPRLRHGLIAHRVSTETSGPFTRDDPVPIQGETLRFVHTLRLFDGADEDTGYELFRSLWTGAARTVRPTAKTLEEYSREFFERAARDHWIDLSSGTDTAGTFKVGLASKTDRLTGVDAWYSVRHQSLRTAFGMLLYSDRTGHAGLRRKAELALAHAMTAPHPAGLIPSLFISQPDKGTREWVLDSWSAGDPDHYHSLDVATTCYWMLELAKRLPDQKPEILRRCLPTSRFFRENQTTTGAFPSFFDKTFHSRKGPLRDGSAETGSVARFLIEYGTLADDEDAIESARKALEHIEVLLSRRRWWDAESIRPDGPSIDPRSGVQREGTLGLIQCALAVARFGKLYPSPRWNKLCDRLLGQLSRYQQSWSPPWIDGARVGGFGAGNFDNRWNDARQSIAALAFFAGYRLTGDRQWLERGSAALAAGLQTSDHDHQPPRDGSGPTASVHWGPGTACTTAEIARESLGEAVVDARLGIVQGIDAVWFEDFELTADQLSARVLTHAPGLGATRLRFRNLAPELQRLTIVVNGTRVGTFDPGRLRAGIPIEPVFVPQFRYLPPDEIGRHIAWRPHATIASTKPQDYRPRVEIRFGATGLETIPLEFDPEYGAFVAKEGLGEHQALPVGSELQSKLLFDVAGRTYSIPSAGFHKSRVSDFRKIDVGDGTELELDRQPGSTHRGRSRIRWFVDGSEFGRHASGEGGFTYLVPVATQTNKLEFVIRAAGRLRVRVGDVILHESKDGPATGRARDLTLELADHRMWTSAAIPLTFEPVEAVDAIDVASIRYRSTGNVASIEGLGATDTRKEPDKQLRVVVQPLTLVDRPLNADRESLQLTFFGGKEYELTPRPNSQRTAGSVAEFIDSLSGGRTTFHGAVLPVRSWNTVSSETDRVGTELPEEIGQQVLAAHESANVIVCVLGESRAPLPKPRHLRVRHRNIPVVFVSARSGDGSFLSCGAATSAILRACYRTHQLDTPEWGNFGTLALSGTDSHLPAGPIGVNLARTGWSDHLILERRTHTNLVVSPLSEGRVGYVLDCDALPSRGQMFLEYRGSGERRGAPADRHPLASTGQTQDGSGVLIYWQFNGEQPLLKDRRGRRTRPRILRLSPTLNLAETPYSPGTRSDLFRIRTSRLPAETLTGERLWDIVSFRVLGNDQATFDVRYLGEDLSKHSRTQWILNPGERREKIVELGTVRTPGTVHHRSGEAWLSLPEKKGSRLRMLAPDAEGLFRMFGQVRGVRGKTRLVFGCGERELVAVELEGVTTRRWLQVDIPANAPTWLDVVNTDGGEAGLIVSSLTRIPRVQPVYKIRTAEVETTHSTRLMDGVVHGRTVRLKPKGTKTSQIKVPILLPKGPTAIRVRAGLEHGLAEDAEARLSMTLINRDGTRQVRLLENEPVRFTRKGSLFLAVLEIAESVDENVEFLRVEWSGPHDLHLVDLAVIRP